MKKTLLFLCSFLLLACSHTEVESEDSLAQEENSTSQIVQSQESSTQAEGENENPENLPVAGYIFDEKENEHSYLDVPKAYVDAGIPIADIQDGMVNYYRENFTKADKEKNFSPIANEDIESLQALLDNSSLVADLGAQVDQIDITIDGDQLHVIRIVIPSSYQEAERKLEENDIKLLNEVFAQSENRLVMLGYYEEDKDLLTPLHLTTRYHPVFYNEYID